MAPIFADLNIVRTQVDVRLIPDLPSGRYVVFAAVPDHPPVEVGEFRLLAQSVGRQMSAETIANPTEARFGAHIHLLGYALPKRQVAAGDSVPLTLYWRTDAALTARYKVFAHLLGETFNARSSNFLWGQQDNEPQSGQAPTSRWTPGAIIVDPYLIPVEADAPPGSYTIELGLYGLTDGVRLEIDAPGARVHADALYLATVEVVP
jgi:hypothetical protein